MAEIVECDVANDVARPYDDVANDVARPYDDVANDVARPYDDVSNDVAGQSLTGQRGLLTRGP